MQEREPRMILGLSSYGRSTTTKFDLKEFVRAAAIRALRTFAEGMLGVVGTTAVGITQVD